MPGGKMWLENFITNHMIMRRLAKKAINQEEKYAQRFTPWKWTITGSVRSKLLYP
jgi:hypothetical protein